MTDRVNRLHGQTSPYLLQHAGNPVAWHPWDEAALAEARRLDRPILLSIGYAACHWCHVMAHESFEDPETAALMNRLFVSVKVDREERPDIDHLYMSALQALGEQGGWPLTMFLAPDGAPFWGGTYFPPEPRWGRPSFRQVLETVADAYRRGDERVSRNSQSLQELLRRAARTSPGTALGPADLDAARRGYLRLVDPLAGGLRGAPKFPNAPIFRFLWQDGLRTGDRLALDAVRRMLVQMSNGGIYDHLAGGYARYATDAAWLVPHFEKMLYDNAQLLELLVLAHADAPDALFARRIEETVGWLDRDMTALHEAGLAPFAASEDADSEGEEGRFYVWSEAEIDRLLGDRSPAFKAAYDVSAAGNWEGRTILHRVTALGDARAEAAIDADRMVLFAARGRRVRPGRDDKILADWNALTVSALCRAAAVLDRPEWLARAAAAFDFLLTRMRAPDGRIQHAWRLGRIAAAGLVDDQAATARAALALFEATGDAARLHVAMELADAAQAWFADADGAFCTTAADAVDVPLARPRMIADNATPSGIGLMAEVLARLYLLTGGTRWRDRADVLIRAFSGAREQLSGMPTLLAAADLLDNGACAVIVGPADHALARSLHATALRAPDPAVAVLRVSAGAALPIEHPAYGKSAGEAGAAGYVCRAGVCGLPTSGPAELAALLHRTPAPHPSPALSGESCP